MICLCSQWDEIDGFQYPKEYDAFVDWIEGHVKSGAVSEVAVVGRDKYATLKERWFRCGECEKIWRLVEHDFPFKGLFESMPGKGTCSSD